MTYFGPRANGDLQLPDPVEFFFSADSGRVGRNMNKPHLTAPARILDSIHKLHLRNTSTGLYRPKIQPVYGFRRASLSASFCTQHRQHRSVSTTMATENSKHMVESNEKYASTFDKGHLPSPPAKKYTVGM
jgi:hypothetical protein